MASFSLVNVAQYPWPFWVADGNVYGSWIQHHVGGTIESAKKVAEDTNAVNGNRLAIEVCEYRQDFNYGDREWRVARGS
jgi:hypothetical protein